MPVSGDSDRVGTRNGFLREVMKGWYIPSRPDEPAGDSTAWYAAYWAFAAQYRESRFGDEWCLSADESLLLHVGDRTVPLQLLLRAPKGTNKPTPLPHGTSVMAATPARSLIACTPTSTATAAWGGS